MRKTIITFSLMAFLAACGTNPAQPPVTTVKQPAINQKPPITAPKASAFLELEVSGLGTDLTPTATAQFIKPGNLNSKAVTVQPVTGGSSLDDVQFTKNSVSFYDDSASSTRYVVATFNITNRFNFAWDNLTLYAVNTSSATGGTAVAGMWDAGNTLLTDETKYRALLPAHGMMTGVGGTPAVNQNIADLQWFTPEEAYSVKTQAVTQSIIPNGSSVLQYGFVARNLSNGRGIAARNTGTNCTINDCKGTVTFAYSFPIGASNNPQRFRTQFVIGNETDSQISQSTQEQTANKVAGVTDVSGFGQARVLTGSTFGSKNKKLLGSIQTAIGTTSNPLAKLFPTPVSGALDAGFGTNGVVSTPIGCSAGTKAVAVQPDGKIVAVGYNYCGGDEPTSTMAMVRHNSDGSLDSSFDVDGIVMTPLGLYAGDEANAVAVQSDGKIVVAGTTDGDFVVIRYNMYGIWDNSFNGNGAVKTDFGDFDVISAMVLQPDGKILVAGNSGIQIALARYNSNGSLDTTFDTDGKLTMSIIAGKYSEAKALILQPDGKILIAGSTYMMVPNPLNSSVTISVSAFAAVRYNSNGSLDTSFDTDGKVTTIFDSKNGNAMAMALQSNGKIVLVGSSIINSSQGFTSCAMVRYNSDGSLDSDFDTDGKMTPVINTTASFLANQQVNAVAIQSNEKIVVAGLSNDNTGPHIIMARFNSNGSFDTSFNTTGKLVQTALGTSNAIGFQPDGKIVLAEQHFSPNLELTRINP
jgi:uncharacterized delta-60 repeat protein